MDATTADDIARLIDRYERAVRETRTFSAERHSFGRYRAGAPYFERSFLHQLVESCNGDELFTPALREKYERIQADFALLEREGGRAYREELFHDLSVYTEAYRTMICYHELGICDADEIADSSIREEIGILLDELDGEFPTSEITALIVRLDDELRSIQWSSCTVRTASNTSEEEAKDLSGPAWQRQSCSRRSGERTGPM